MRRVTSILLAMMLMVVGVTGCGKSTTGSTVQSGSSSSSDTSAQIGSLKGKIYAEINIKDYGIIKVELDADSAPITVNNFVKLVNEGFYDGLTFHRIIEGFMMQGGDPMGNGTGGSDETIKGEFSENGVRNDISHERGTLSMARSADPDSGSSQFFIVHQDSTYLDGQYAGFGKVIEGMEVVDKICTDVPVKDDNGTVDVEFQPVIVNIKIVQ